MTAPIDLQVLESLAEDLGGDREVIGTVLAAYVEYFPSRRDALAAAIAAADITAIVETAHALASASVTIGVRAVFAPARAIENQANIGELDGVDELLSLIDAVYGSVVEVINAWH